MKSLKTATIVGLLATLLSVSAEAAPSTTPKAPPTLTATISSTNVVLVWTAPTTNTDGTTVKLTGFNVYRSTTTPIKQQTGTGAPAPLVPYSIKASTLTYTDSGAASLNDYYAISAYYCDSTGCTEGVAGPTVRASASTPATPTSVDVVGTAKFSWAPPTMRSDGSALTNLAGYRLYRGPTCDNQPTVTTLSNPGLVAYQDTNVPLGPYCYALTSYDTNNVESLKSPGLLVTFTAPPSLPGAPGQPVVSCQAVAPQGMAVSCTVTP